MYRYINSLPQSDKNIINTELTTFASLNLSYDNPSNRAYQYKLKHLIGALFTLFKSLTYMLILLNLILHKILVLIRQHVLKV